MKAIVIPGDDVDTDQIMPARFMTEITFDNMGKYLFADTGYVKGKSGDILLVGKNFGCGSSREHAPQAIKRFGIKAIIGESFAEIFAGNCAALGIPLYTMPKQELDKLKAGPLDDFNIDLNKLPLVKEIWDILGMLKENEELINKKMEELNVNNS